MTRLGLVRGNSHRASDRNAGRGSRARRLALAAVLAGCPALARAQASSASPPAPQRAALEIDGERVPWEEFACWLVRFQGEEHVRDFVRRRALERAAGKEGLGDSDDELRARIESQVTQRVESAFGGDRDGWRAELARLGQTEAEFFAVREEEARSATWIEALVRRGRAITEAELHDAWEREYGPGGKRFEVRVLHLAVQPPAGEPGETREEADAAQRAAREQVEAQARALRERALAGEDFEALVRAHSDDAETRARGGLLANRFDPSSWSAPAFEAVRGLEPGEISQPVFARGGFDLFRLERIELTPFDEVADALRNELADLPPTAGETRALFDELTAGIEVQILPELAKEVRGAGSEPQGWRLDRPVIAIGGEPVLRGEFAAWLTLAVGAPLVRTFAEMRLVERAAADAGVEVSSAEVERRLREDVEQRIEVYHDGDRKAWLASLADRGLTEEAYLRTLSMRSRHDLLAERSMLARREITPEMVRNEWETRYGAQGKSPDVRFVERTLREPEKDEVKTRAELERYVEQETRTELELLAGLRKRADAGEDFATLVRLYSQDPETRERGGRSAGRFELHTWPEDAQRAILALQAGQCTEPIEIGHRFYLFELVGTTVVPLAEVEAQLRDDLLHRRPAMVEIAGFVNQLYQAHQVRTLPGLYGR